MVVVFPLHVKQELLSRMTMTQGLSQRPEGQYVRKRTGKKKEVFVLFLIIFFGASFVGFLEHLGYKSSPIVNNWAKN